MGGAMPPTTLGEHSGQGTGQNTSGSAANPTSNYFLTQAQSAQGAASGGSSDTFQIYQGMPPRYAPQVDSGGNVRVGRHITQPITTDSTTYINQLIAYQTSNPTLYKQYQKEMYQAGYYGSAKPIYGTYTGQDGQAFSRFIQDYGAKNGSLVMNGLDQITPEQYLADTIKVGGTALNPGPTKAPLTINYSDPAALRGVLQQAAQKNLGRDFSPKEMAGFIAEFHGKEAASQRANYNNAGSATSPDAGGQAQDFVDQGFTMEEGQRRGATFVDSLNSMLGVL